MPYHVPPTTLRLRRLAHRIIDPFRSYANYRSVRRTLQKLPDGDYRSSVTVPYVSQFATPTLINDYIYGDLHGRDDPNWRSFGANHPDTYHFWAQRACAIACLKMAVDAFRSVPPMTLWHMVRDGLALGGYLVHDEDGNPTDQGWFFEPLVALGARYALEVTGLAYISELELCRRICDGWLVAAAVSPELGERRGNWRYDGHFVLVYGFTWKNHAPTQFILHNPSGRYPELQAGAVISARRFRQTFAHRCILFRQQYFISSVPKRG